MRAHGSRSVKKQRSKAMACNSHPNYQWFEILMRDDVMYYGMGLLGPVPPKNATKNTSVCHHFVRWQWVLLVPVPKCKRLWKKTSAFQSISVTIQVISFFCTIVDVSFSFLQSTSQDLRFAVSFSLFQYKRSELCCQLLISSISIRRFELIWHWYKPLNSAIFVTRSEQVSKALHSK